MNFLVARKKKRPPIENPYSEESRQYLQRFLSRQKREDLSQ